MLNRRSLFTSAAVLPAIAILGACANTNGGNLPADLLVLIKKIQDGVLTACGLFVKFDALVGLVAGFFPAFSTAEAAIKAICAAIPPTASGASRVGQAVTLTVAGKPVEGVFVR